MMVSKTARRLSIGAVTFLAFVATETRALAQGVLPPERGGFTIIVDLGIGVQRDADLGGAAVGLAGLNLGVGGFLTEDVALLFRISGTNVAHGSGVSRSINQVSGVGGPVLQFWLSDRFNVEAGGGFGFWGIDSHREVSFGAILGAGFTVLNRGKHNLQFGVQYAPAFTKPAVHNIGFTFGYQFL